MTEAGWTRGKDVKVEGWYWWEVEEETGLSLKVVQVEKGFTWIENEGRDVLYVVGYGGLLENKPGRFKGPITPGSYQQGWVAANVDALVDRFLAWPLPASVCSDLCATKQGYPHRSGTNLLSAVEAKAMIEHVLGIAQQAQEGGVGDGNSTKV